MVEIRRVSYAYNSAITDTPYFLDVMVSRDGVTLVDVHQQLGSKEEFDEAIEGLIPLLGKEDE